MKPKNFVVVLLLIMIWLGGCSKDKPTAGNSSESSNAFIMGKLVDTGSNPVAGALVRIYPADYVPSFGSGDSLSIPVETTDAKGIYRIGKQSKGVYNIEGEKGNTGAFIDSIEIDQDSITVPDAILKLFGKVTGIIHMTGQNDTNQVRVTLYMPGTRRITKPNIGGRFNFDYMPEGSYQMIIDPTLNEYSVKVMNLSVSAGGTLNLDTVYLERYVPDTIDVINNIVNGIWGPNKTYRITVYAVIPQSETLTILPNTNIVMVNGTFENKGNLIAVGEEDKPIIFSSVGNIISTSFISSSFVCRYCVFENVPVYLYLNRGQKINISNCVIKSFSEYGVFINGDSSSMIIDTLTFYNNIFYNGSGYAIHISANNVFLLRNNIFYNIPYVFWVRRALNGNNPNIITDYNCYFQIKNAISDTTTTTDLISINANQHDVLSDPGFLSIISGAEDYHLQLNSPCKGTGINGTDMGVYSTYQP